MPEELQEANMGFEADASDTPENGYESYKELKGIINEKDYQSALERSKQTTTLDEPLVAQAEAMAAKSGFELHNSEDHLDPRTVLYGILRTDQRAPDQKYHHDQMSDQRIFAEALRMSGDAESLEKLIKAHPNIFSN